MSLTWRWLRVLLPVAIFLPIILACPARPLEDPVDTPRVQDNRYFPQSIEKDVDLLFMIDNSNSMESKQDNLQKNFPNFIEALRSPKLGPIPGKTCTATDTRGCKIPNVRIGVVSSDLGAGQFSFQTCEAPGGDRGVLKTGPGKLAAPGCATPKDPWISYSENASGQIVTNVQNAKSADPVDQVKEAFSCIAYLGTGGCGFEHQLESVKRALDGCQSTNKAVCKTNPGFIRDDAYLAIVWLTDEDDCSAKRTDLFDPTQQGLNDPLGPLNSFRCTEFGLTCAEKLREPGVKHNCVPKPDYLYAVDGYVEFFRGLKPPGRAILFAIAGPTQPVEVGLDGTNPTLKASCNSVAGTGVPGIRIASVVKTFGEQGHFNEGLDKGNKVEVNICSPDFTPALQLLGAVIVASLGGQCISAPPLTKSGALACRAGDKLGGSVTCAESCLDKVDCVIEEKVGQGASTPVKQCSAALFEPSVKQKDCGAECPCWRIVPNAECQAGRDGSPYGLQIMRAGEVQKGTVAVARCATTPYAWGSAEFSQLQQCK